MPKHRVDLSLQREEASHLSSTSHATALLPSPQLTESPASPLSPLSPTHSKESHDYLNAIRSPIRSITLDSLFPPNRSKSPKPRLQSSDGSLPSPPLALPATHSMRQSKTTPVPSTSTALRPQQAQQRHKSDSTNSPHLTRESSTDGHFFQKRQKKHGSLDHYGRHGNDWLFGGVSLRETARSLVQKR
jgi:hypothetical protein